MAQGQAIEIIGFKGKVLGLGGGGGRSHKKKLLNV